MILLLSICLMLWAHQSLVLGLPLKYHQPRFFGNHHILQYHVKDWTEVINIIQYIEWVNHVIWVCPSMVSYWCHSVSVNEIFLETVDILSICRYPLEITQLNFENNMKLIKLTHQSQRNVALCVDILNQCIRQVQFLPNCSISRKHLLHCLLCQYN